MFKAAITSQHRPCANLLEDRAAVLVVEPQMGAEAAVHLVKRVVGWGLWERK